MANELEIWKRAIELEALYPERAQMSRILAYTEHKLEAANTALANAQKEAIERCARVCEELGRRELCSYPTGGCDPCEMLVKCGERQQRCADAIRALIGASND